MMISLDAGQSVTLTLTDTGWTVTTDGVTSDPELAVLVYPISMNVGAVGLFGPEQTRISQSATPITITGTGVALDLDFGGSLQFSVVGAIRFITTSYTVVDEALIESLGMDGSAAAESDSSTPVEEGDSDASV
jgi:hypothetical protein